MKSKDFRCVALLVAFCYLTFILEALIPSACANDYWVKTYDTSDNLTEIFNPGDTVRIKAYSSKTPYYIIVKNPDGETIFTDTSNTTNYSRDVTGITTKLGWWNITLGSIQNSYASSMMIVDAFNMESTDFSYVERDLTTRGNWTESGYGDCGYALPYAELKSKQNAIGETTGIGETAHEFWWREPWSVLGENYTYPYEDFRGGHNILEYNITGPEGPPRALVNASSQYYRPSWYCHNFSITVTLNVTAGDYNVSIYFLDWDAPFLWRHRKLEVNVTSSGSWNTTQLGVPRDHDNFAAGIYARFEVEATDSVIKIEVKNLWSITNVVLSGIFLDQTSGVTGVNFLGFDRETMGNWRPTYGNDYYLLPGFNVPASNVSYIPINKTYDETNIPSGNYEVSEGVCQFAADDARTYGGYPYIGGYAAYAWTLPLNLTASDPRVLIYPENRTYNGYPPTPLNERIYGQWDCGEFVGPLNYLIIRLKIPKGEYVLSIYALDWARANRSETIEIWDESMTSLLDSQHISSDEINNGTYVQWFVNGSRTINIKVIADPGNLNCFIDGIFLNCIKARAVVWYHVIPEVPLGILAITAACFAALSLKRIRYKR